MERSPLCAALGVRMLRPERELGFAPNDSAAAQTYFSTVTPFQIEGDCLRPYLLHGDHVLVDRSLEARDGDLVLITLPYERLGMLGAQSSRYLSSIKQLRIGEDGSRELTCADGTMVADRVHVEGVVVCAVLSQWWSRFNLRKIVFQPDSGLHDRPRPRRDLWADYGAPT